MLVFAKQQFGRMARYQMIDGRQYTSSWRTTAYARTSSVSTAADSKLTLVRAVLLPIVWNQQENAWGRLDRLRVLVFCRRRKCRTSSGRFGSENYRRHQKKRLMAALCRVATNARLKFKPTNQPLRVVTLFIELRILCVPPVTLTLGMWLIK